MSHYHFFFSFDLPRGSLVAYWTKYWDFITATCSFRAEKLDRFRIMYLPLLLANGEVCFAMPWRWI
jgi:hypothetical protein